MQSASIINQSPILMTNSRGILTTVGKMRNKDFISCKTDFQVSRTQRQTLVSMQELREYCFQEPFLMSLRRTSFRQTKDCILSDSILILRKLYVSLLHTMNINHASFYKCLSITLFQIYCLDIALTVKK